MTVGVHLDRTDLVGGELGDQVAAPAPGAGVGDPGAGTEARSADPPPVQVPCEVLAFLEVLGTTASEGQAG